MSTMNAVVRAVFEKAVVMIEMKWERSSWEVRVVGEDAISAM